MISNKNTRIQITISKDFLPRIQDAADTWGMTLSQYICSLCKADLETGLTAQMSAFVAAAIESEADI